jgi:hypothetical protein
LTLRYRSEFQFYFFSKFYLFYNQEEPRELLEKARSIQYPKKCGDQRVQWDTKMIANSRIVSKLIRPYNEWRVFAPPPSHQEHSTQTILTYKRQQMQFQFNSLRNTKPTAWLTKYVVESSPWHPPSASIQYQIVHDTEAPKRVHTWTVT